MGCHPTRSRARVLRGSTRLRPHSGLTNLPGLPGTPWVLTLTLVPPENGPQSQANREAWLPTLFTTGQAHTLRASALSSKSVLFWLFTILRECDTTFVRVQPINFTLNKKFIMAFFGPKQMKQDTFWETKKVRPRSYLEVLQVTYLLPFCHFICLFHLKSL